MFDNGEGLAGCHEHDSETRFSAMDPFMAGDDVHACDEPPGLAHAQSTTPSSLQHVGTASIYCQRPVAPPGQAQKQHERPPPVGSAQAPAGRRTEANIEHAPPEIWVTDDPSQVTIKTCVAEAKPAQAIGGYMPDNEHAVGALFPTTLAQTQFRAEQVAEEPAQQRGQSSGTRPSNQVNALSPLLRTDVQRQLFSLNATLVRPKCVAASLQSERSVADARNSPRSSGHAAQRPGMQMSDDPVDIHDSEIPELLEACVRSELIYWLRNTPVARVARSQVMQRVADVPDWAAPAMVADRVETVCQVMAPLLSVATKQILGKMASWMQFVILKSAVMFAPLWRRAPDAVVRMLADLAMDSLEISAHQLASPGPLSPSPH